MFNVLHASHSHFHFRDLACIGFSFLHIDPQFCNMCLRISIVYIELNVATSDGRVKGFRSSTITDVLSEYQLTLCFVMFVIIIQNDV